MGLRYNYFWLNTTTEVRQAARSISYLANVSSQVPWLLTTATSQLLATTHTHKQASSFLTVMTLYYLPELINEILLNVKQTREGKQANLKAASNRFCWNGK